MKKLFLLLLLFAGALGTVFAADVDDLLDEEIYEDEVDDFDDIFSQDVQDITVEQSTPVIQPAASTPAASAISFTGHFDGDVGLSAIIIEKPDFGGYLNLSNTLSLKAGHIVPPMIFDFLQSPEPLHCSMVHIKACVCDLAPVAPGAVHSSNAAFQLK